MDTPQDSAKGQDPAASDAAVSSAPVEPQRSSAVQKLVLLVDDDDDVREILRFMVGKEGFQTDIFPDGLKMLDAIERLGDRRPDLVVLDIMLPKRNGVEILHDLQEQGLTGIPVLVITGRVLDATLLEEIKQEPNVVGFMAKPITTEGISAKIHSILGTTKIQSLRVRG